MEDKVTEKYLKIAIVLTSLYFIVEVIGGLTSGSLSLLGDAGHMLRDIFSLFITLELAKKHTWENLQENKEATYIFFQPPVISYELRGKIEIDDEGIYKKFVNAQHDVYHTPKLDKWGNRPALIFHIEEIYDNSASKNGFGVKLQYP